MKHFDFNLQYLEVVSRFLKTFGCEDAATNPISTLNFHFQPQPQIQTAYISPVSTH